MQRIDGKLNQFAVPVHKLAHGEFTVSGSDARSGSRPMPRPLPPEPNLIRSKRLATLCIQKIELYSPQERPIVKRERVARGIGLCNRPSAGSRRNAPS